MVVIDLGHTSVVGHALTDDQSCVFWILRSLPQKCFACALCYISKSCSVASYVYLFSSIWEVLIATDLMHSLARLDITILEQVGQVPDLHDAKVVSKVEIDAKFLFIDVSVVVRVEILHARQVVLAHLIELSFNLRLSVLVLLKCLLKELEP